MIAAPPPTGPLALGPAAGPDRWSLAPPPPRVPTLDDDLARFLAAAAAHRTPKTATQYRWVLRRFLRFLGAQASGPATGADLTPAHAAAFVRELARTRPGTPPTTLMLYTTVVGRFYAFLGLAWVRGLAAAAGRAEEGAPPPGADPWPASPPARGLPPGVRPSQHPVLVYLGTLNSERSRDSTRSNLRRAAAFLSGGRQDLWSFPWSRLTYADLVGLRAAMALGLARRSVNARLSAVRQVARTCWRLGRMSAEAYERIRDVRLIPGHEEPAGRAFAPGELAALLSACRADPRPIGVRDRALLALLYGAGVRVFEACGLDLDCYDPKEGVVRVVAGKGNKDRTIPVHPGLVAHLADWLALRGDRPGPLFVALDRAAAVRAGRAADLAVRRLTTQSVRAVCRRRAALAGTPPFTPHDARHSFVGDLLEAGVDIATAQKLAGHADPTTTAAYDRRGFQTRRTAVARLDVPL